MKTLDSNLTQLIAGGAQSIDYAQADYGSLRIDVSASTSSGATVIVTSAPQGAGTLVRLNRFDANFTAPSDSPDEDHSMFLGLNDQGGIV